MAHISWEACDSSPAAKRAKMEFDSDDWLSEPRGSRSNVRPELRKKTAAEEPDAGRQSAMVTDRDDADPQHKQLTCCSSSDAMAFDPSFDGGVSSSSDNMGECFNGGDSGFNELLPTTSLDSGDDMLLNKKQSEEPDSSAIDGLEDYDDILPDNLDDKDEVASTISHLSGLSDLSDLSGQDWKPIAAGPMGWVQQQMHMGVNPRTLIQDLVPPGTHIPQHLDDIMLWKIILNMLSEPPCRKKLPDINTLENAVELIHCSKNIIVLTGAGVSVSCGIPDFRSKDGVYARLAKDFPDLPDPQAMFDIHYFRKDPRPFFKFAKEIYPGQFQPSPSHRFIKLIEDHGKLLRNYSQNIDTLEQIAGIQRVIQCHGSFATASCTRCHKKVDAAEIQDDVLDQKLPQCTSCEPDAEILAVMKPDIVFFGEGLPEEFHNTMGKDKDQCDLLIVIGSSLKVRPVALIPNSLPGHVPQILINREPLKHLNFDIELLGDCDVIVNELCLRLGDGWKHLAVTESLNELSELPPRTKEQTEAAAAVLDKQQESIAQSSFASTSGCNLSLSTCNNAPCDIECDSTSDKASKEPDSSTTTTTTTTTTEENTLIYGVKRYLQNISADMTEREDPTKPDDDIEALRACWKPTLQENLAERLPGGAFLFIPPNRYIFKGAEVFSDSEVESLPENSSVVDNKSDDLDSSSIPESSTDDDDAEKNSKDVEFLDERTGSGDDSGVGDMKIDQIAHSSSSNGTKMEDEVITDWMLSSSSR